MLVFKVLRKKIEEPKISDYIDAYMYISNTTNKLVISTSIYSQFMTKQGIVDYFSLIIGNDIQFENIVETQISGLSIFQIIRLIILFFRYCDERFFFFINDDNK